MVMSEWIESVLQSEERLAIPIMTHPGIEMINKKVIDAVKNGEIHFKAVEAIHNNFPGAAANIMMDLTVEAEAFGCKINFSEDEVPNVASRIVYDEKSINDLPVPSLQNGRVPEYLKAAKLAAEKIKSKPVFAGCIGPISLAGRLFDMSEMMTSLYIEPEMIKILLGKCTDFLKKYVFEFKWLGANGVIMAEPAAGLLSGDMCDEFSSNYIKEIVDEVQDDNFLFILHNCGNTGQATQSMISTRAHALHFGNKIDIVGVLNEVPGNILVLGNLDPVGVFKLSDTETIYNETLNLLERTAMHKNYIISSGCDLPPGVPLENVNAFYNALSFFNK
ncbi:MAG: methylcobamide--CoM methyltransferase [Ignavibacteriales bacterium]|nr:MAG: methylcobamide--CoM methyltransferase [Ignavibacteriales bacterium]